MLTMEFKFEWVCKINECVNHSSQFISVKVKKNFLNLRLFSGKAKNIDAQAKLWFSYKKKRV